MKYDGRRPREPRTADAAVVVLEPGQALNVALRIFKRRVERAGLLREVRDREHYRSPSTRRRLKSRRARKRDAKAARSQQPQAGEERDV